MDEFLSEREQVDRIRQWWKQNGAWIIIGIGAGVLAIAAWNWWQGWQLQRAEQASAIYSVLAQAAEEGRTDEVRLGVERLSADFRSSPYLPLGRLALAAALVRDGDAEAAAGQLDTVINEAKDPQLALVARVRLARLLASEGEHDRALRLVEVAAAGPFSAALLEIKGDMLAARGDLDGARQAYRQALESAGTLDGVIDEELLQLKLEALGGGIPAGGETS